MSVPVGGNPVAGPATGDARVPFTENSAPGAGWSDDHVQVTAERMTVRRASGVREPAEPNSAKQQERYASMLRAAGRLGAQHGLERMQMHDVAREAGVAIATLYRYFPSKTHLFAALMHDRVLRLDAERPSPPPDLSPVEAVVQLLVKASGQLFEQPLLALAMMQSNNAHSNNAQSHNVASVGDGTAVRQTDEIVRDLVLRTASVTDPTDRELRAVRILEQAWYGLLTTVLYERSSVADAQEGIRLACALLLGPVIGDRRS